MPLPFPPLPCFFSDGALSKATQYLLVAAVPHPCLCLVFIPFQYVVLFVPVGYFQVIPLWLAHWELIKWKNPASRMGNSAGSSLQRCLAVLSLGWWCHPWLEHAWLLPVCTMNSTTNPMDLKTAVGIPVFFEILPSPSLERVGKLCTPAAVMTSLKRDRGEKAQCKSPSRIRVIRHWAFKGFKRIFRCLPCSLHCRYRSEIIQGHT